MQPEQSQRRKASHFSDAVFVILLILAVGHLLLPAPMAVWTHVGSWLGYHDPAAGIVLQYSMALVFGIALTLRARTVTHRRGLAVAPPVPDGTPSQADIRWAMAAHLSALSGPPTLFLGALVLPLGIWVYKIQNPFVYYHGREAACFNIMTAGTLFVLMLVGQVWPAWLGRGLPFWIALALLPLWAILVVRGGLHAKRGLLYRYPVSSRFVHWWVPKPR